MDDNKEIPGLFLPTTCLILFGLLGTDAVYGNGIAHILVSIIVPLYIGYILGLALCHYREKSAFRKLGLYALAGIAAIHSICMVFISYDVWQWMLHLKSVMDPFDAVVCTAMIVVALIIMSLSGVVVFSVISNKHRSNC